jgi:beta-N-acetylhexosaminidase
MASEIVRAGVNFNFAPCADLDCDPPCEAIGGFERSYSTEPAVVSDYCRVFVQAMREVGVLSCVKHFPGHGLARGDTHNGVVDVTETWQEEELLPYRNLVKTDDLDSVMVAHIIHQEVDPETPASLSISWLQKLREEIEFDGVAVSDDLHMGAILQHFDFREIVKRSILAGVDLLVFSNNPTAAQGVPDFSPDPELPVRFAEVVEELLVSGEVTQKQCQEGIGRVLELKKQVSLSS